MIVYINLFSLQALSILLNYINKLEIKIRQISASFMKVIILVSSLLPNFSLIDSKTADFKLKLLNVKLFCRFDNFLHSFV